MVRRYGFLLALLLLSACASDGDYSPSYTYNQILIVNNSKELIKEINLVSEVTGRTFGCGNIAPLGICSNQSSPRRYREGPVRIDWVFGNNPRKVEELTPRVPAYFQPGLPLQIVLEISPTGRLSARFEQISPLN